jgi:hypothetical protein
MGCLQVKRAFPFFVILISLCIVCTNYYDHRNDKSPPDPFRRLPHEPGGKPVSYTHTAFDIASVIDSNLHDTIARCEPYPSSSAERWQNEIESSRRYYEKGDFGKAADILSKAVVDDSDNCFILESYARTLYKIDGRKGESFSVYEKIMNTMYGRFVSDHSYNLDSIKRDIYVNSWFLDAYWKIGTLCLDRKEWGKAAFYLECAIVGFETCGMSQGWEQPLMYLAEAYFEAGEMEYALYWCCETLRKFPMNTYVLKYQASMGKRCE